MASISDGGNMIMPVAPSGGGGFGNLGNDGAWWIILFVILFGARGWGNNNQGDPSYAVQAGFNQAALSSGIAGVQTSLVSGFADVNSALCAGFAGVNASINNGFYQAQIAEASRQMADMQQNFAIQQGLSQCCCENRSAIADLKYTIAQENCADRQAVNDALVVLSNNMNAGIQALKDEFCQDRLAQKDAIISQKDETIGLLRAQMNEMSRQASQNAQTAQILANNEAQTEALEQYLAPVPRPAYIFQNPNCCGSTVCTACGA